MPGLTRACGVKRGACRCAEAGLNLGVPIECRTCAVDANPKARGRRSGGARVSWRSPSSRGKRPLASSRFPSPSRSVAFSPPSPTRCLHQSPWAVPTRRIEGACPAARASIVEYPAHLRVPSSAHLVLCPVVSSPHMYDSPSLRRSSYAQKHVCADVCADVCLCV